MSPIERLRAWRWRRTYARRPRWVEVEQSKAAARHRAMTGENLPPAERRARIIAAMTDETPVIEVSPRDFEAMTEDRPGRVLPGLRAMVEKVRGGSDE